MIQAVLLPLIFAIAAIGLFFLGHQRALAVAGGHIRTLHSTPGYHGGFLAVVSLLPGLALLLVWSFVSRPLSDMFVTSQLGAPYQALTAAEQPTFLRAARALAAGSATAQATDLQREAAGLFAQFNATSATVIYGAAALMAIAGLVYGWRTITQSLRARQIVEKTVMAFLVAASGVAIVTTLGIVLSLAFESYRFFEKVPIFDFLFGLHWSPQSAFEGAGAGDAGNAKVFGAVPVFAGTLLITLIAIAVAAPIGLLSAVYLSDYASPRVRAIVKPLLEILAGIPTVVYGFFAALTVAPLFRNAGEFFGLGVSSESALAAGLVMGIMIIPYISSLSDDVINAVPQSLRDGSAGLGATKSETILRVVLPAALPGIVSALMLAISRAIGETMIVVMAAGLAANLTANPLEAVTTVTVQIVTLLVGDQEFDSAKTLAAFALGLVLFCVTLLLNVIALQVIRKYQEQYD